MVALHPPSHLFSIRGLGVVETLFPIALVVGAFGFLDLSERRFGGRIAAGALVLGFGDPGVEALDEFGGRFGIVDGVEALRVGLEVEELRLGSRGCEPLGWKGGEFAFALQLPQQRHAGVLIFLVAGPVQSRLFGMKVPHKPTIRRDDGSDAIHGIATAIPRREELLASRKVAAENGFALHPLRHG